MSTDPFANPHAQPKPQGLQQITSPFGMSRAMGAQPQQQPPQPQQQLQTPFGNGYGSPAMPSPGGMSGTIAGAPSANPSNYGGSFGGGGFEGNHAHQRHPDPAATNAGSFSSSAGFQQPAQPPVPGVYNQPPHPAAPQVTGSQPGMFDQFAPADPVLRTAAMMGMNSAQEVVQSGLSKYMPGMAIFWNTLRYHFNVNNQYVVHKLRLLLFPFRQATWAREVAQGPGGTHGKPQGGPVRYAPPVADINAPDLYIPVMAFGTYVLLVGLVKGTRMKFTPEETISATLLTQTLEVLVMKLCTYMLPAGSSMSIGLLDLVIYCSYIYVGLVLDLLAGLLLGQTAYYVMLVYTALTMSCFILRTLQRAVPVWRVLRSVILDI